MENDNKNRREVLAKPRRWSNDTLWGTNYKFQKLYCDCVKCMATANATSRQGRQKGKGK